MDQWRPVKSFIDPPCWHISPSLQPARSHWKVNCLCTDLYDKKRIAVLFNDSNTSSCHTSSNQASCRAPRNQPLIWTLQPRVFDSWWYSWNIWREVDSERFDRRLQLLRGQQTAVEEEGSQQKWKSSIHNVTYKMLTVNMNNVFRAKCWFRGFLLLSFTFWVLIHFQFKCKAIKQINRLAVLSYIFPFISYVVVWSSIKYNTELQNSN